MSTSIMTADVDGGAPGQFGAALIVEDNPIIALDTQLMLEELGFSPVKTLTNLSEGIEKLASQLYDLVILDIKVGEGTSLKFAELLLNRGIRFVFATGYSDTSTLPEVFKDNIVLTKPYTKEQIWKVIT